MRAPPESSSSTGSRRSRGTSLSSARSSTRCAIFVPDGVTRKRKARAATSWSVRGSPPIVASRCVRTIRSAPPRRSSDSQAQHTRPERPLLGPQPAQDELEVGRLDPELAAAVGRRRADTRLVDAQLPGLDLVEDGVDERRLDLRLLAGPRQDAVPVLERPFDRLARSRPVEVVDPEEVCEQAGDAVLEAVELRERVLANREHEVGRRAPPTQRDRELLVERARPSVGPVVEEVLLELVEHDQQRTADPVPPLDADVGEATRRRLGVRAPERSSRRLRGRPPAAPRPVRRCSTRRTARPRAAEPLLRRGSRPPACGGP